MAKLLLVLFLTAFICVATQALSFRPRNIGETVSEYYEENESPHPLVNEVLGDLDDSTEKYNPLILRHVENNLRSMADRVSEKRMLICSTKPSPYCDILG
ncbi:Hypothetical predicted protein [Paramuricea clavata]|uniref:Uncharacterized protein n=1 Tax=Paramuricea clavata TaxID=317549 RepID=A0A7D9J770_PARCT|nr:Hypothetical predicted protein [Paramuricea clavata]